MRRHGMLYALGVLLSFLAFAALLVVLQSLGNAIGWGFQLQSPVFVALLLALFLALALNLSGLFEFSFVLSSGIKSKGKNADAFLTGVLAVAVASPCTAPFMGAALGYALAGGPADALAVFTRAGRRHGAAVRGAGLEPAVAALAAEARRVDGALQAAARDPAVCDGPLAGLGPRASVRPACRCLRLGKIFTGESPAGTKGKASRSSSISPPPGA